MLQHIPRLAVRFQAALIALLWVISRGNQCKRNDKPETAEQPLDVNPLSRIPTLVGDGNAFASWFANHQ